MKDFLCLYGVAGRFDINVLENAVKLAKLRNKLHYYSPDIRPINQYPNEVADVLK